MRVLDVQNNADIRSRVRGEGRHYVNVRSGDDVVEKFTHSKTHTTSALAVGD